MHLVISASFPPSFADLTRQWIPHYFQSLLDNGVTSIHLNLGQCISTYHQSLQELECHNATMETNHTSPHPTKVSCIHVRWGCPSARSRVMRQSLTNKEVCRWAGLSPVRQDS